jgi:hypothetical protein
VKATLVVLNHNSGPVLDDCLASLLALDASDYEVLLIDNASTDGSRERAVERFGGSPRFRLITSPVNLGCAGGRNRGVREGAGEIICFVDSDAYADASWLTAVRRAFADAAVGVVASRLVSVENPLVLNGLGGMLNWQGYGFDIGYGEPVEFTDLTVDPLFACGNGLCTRRDVFDRVGGFDESYVNYYEDVDYSLRVARSGLRVALARDATLYHLLKPDDPTGQRAKLLLCERNRIRTVLKHYPVGMLVRWLREELAHERAVNAAGWYSQGVFREAWSGNISRLPAIAWWRLRHLGLERLDTAGAMLPAWGYAPMKNYNVLLRPDLSHPTDRVRMGEEERGLLYGWYGLEAAGDGTRFRWTDDLAALRITAPQPSPTVALTYFLAPNHHESFVYLRHAATGATVTGRLPIARADPWVTTEVPTTVPAGPIDVILQTPAPYREPDGARRYLGVALRECTLQ